MENVPSRTRAFVTFWLIAVSLMLVFTAWLVFGGLKASVNDGVLSNDSATAFITFFGAIFSFVGISVVLLWIKRDHLVKMAEMEQPLKIPRHVFLRTLWRATSVMLTNGAIFLTYHGLAVLSIGYAGFLIQFRQETYLELMNHPGGFAAVCMALYLAGAMSSETQRSMVGFRQLYPIGLEDIHGVRKASPSFKDKPLFNPDDKIIMLSRRKDQFSIGTVKRLATARWDTVHRYDIEIESSTEPGINPGDTYLKCSEISLRPYYDRIENVG